MDFRFEIMTEVSINKQARLSQHLASPSAAALSHSSELDGLRLTPHFTLGELCKTSAKTQDGNIPSHVHIENLKRLCWWLEKLRSEYNRRYGGLTPDPSLTRNFKGEGSEYKEAPIIINSGYRSAAVNKAVGGVPSSNHLTGCAADIRVENMQQLLRYAVILLDIADESKEAFDELLIEKNARGAIWLHFAVRPQNNRMRIRLIH